MLSCVVTFNQVICPPISEFRDLHPKQFGEYGDYYVWISNSLVVHPIDIDHVWQRRGFNVTIVTTGKNSQGSFFLLKELGLPFAKSEV